MLFKKTFLASSVIAMLSACGSINAEQKLVDSMAASLDVQFQVVDNHGANNGLACQDLGAEWAACNKVDLKLTNNGAQVAAGTQWEIYFHSIRLILESQNPQFKVTRVTGDLHKIEPTEVFDGFAAGEEVVIPMIGEYWTLFETDFMPRAFVNAPGAKPAVIQSLDTEDAGNYVSGITGEKRKRTPGDNNVQADANSRFVKNADLTQVDVSTSLIPKPLKLTAIDAPRFSIQAGIAFDEQPIGHSYVSALKQRAELFGLKTFGSYPVKTMIKPAAFNGDLAVSGAYRLKLTDAGAEIQSFDEAGAFYAFQSIFGLLSLDGSLTLPQVTIEDAPRFAYRGVMVDVARNFHSKQAILATLDQMAAYKLNKLHLHLSDDEAWRIEIPGLPELTEIGAKRCFDLEEKTCLLPQLGSGPDSNNFGSGFFTRQDYIEILRYAKARHIEVIPEIDTPAHARAAVVSMEARYNRLMAENRQQAASEYRLMDPEDTSNVTTVQFYDKRSFINPCMESSKRFVTKVMAEIADMHYQANMPLSTWHFGGDEAKNIKRQAGFQDINATDKVAWKGNIDMSKQHAPFEKSPQCQALVANGTVAGFDQLPSYFAEQVAQIAASKGIAGFQAWQDGLKYSKNAASFATDKTRVNFWDTLFWGGSASAYEWAEKGYDVVISNPDYVYMDMPYEVDPAERGYYWATRASDSRKVFSFAPENLPQNAETSVDRDGNGFTGKGSVAAKPFYGMSAQLWSETVRTDEQFEYMVFPRVLAFAERAWHKADWELTYKPGVEFTQQTQLVNKAVLNTDYQRFANLVGQRELAKLEKAGIDYRLPVPGARVVSGVLEMNVQFPGVALQYSLDNGANWISYTATNKPAVNGKVLIRSVSPHGKLFSRVTEVK